MDGDQVDYAKRLVLNGWNVEAAFRITFGMPKEDITILEAGYTTYSGAASFIVDVVMYKITAPFFFTSREEEAMAAVRTLWSLGAEMAVNGKIIRADDLFTAARFLLECRGWGFPLTAEQRAVDAFLRRLPVRIFAEIIESKLSRVVEYPWKFDEFLF